MSKDVCFLTELHKQIGNIIAGKLVQERNKELLILDDQSDLFLLPDLPDNILREVANHGLLDDLHLESVVEGLGRVCHRGVILDAQYLAMRHQFL